jgi:hypothetical protein
MPLTLSRSLVVVLVPGIVACAPWLLLCAEHASDLTALYRAYQVPGNALLFALVVVVGSILEGIGSRAEVRWDAEREKEFGVQENWYKYLAQTPESEPVGFRYISRTVTTMYFELTMSFAGSIMFLGIGAVIGSIQTDYRSWIAASSIAVAGAAFWFFRAQARDSHKILCKVRLELANRVPYRPAEE